MRHKVRMSVQKSGSFTAANKSCGVQSMNIIVGLFMDVSVPKFIELLRTTKYYGYQSDKNSNMETIWWYPAHVHLEET